MKAGIFVAAALLQIAAAQPHRHNHADVHEKRQVYVTDVSYATVTAAGPDVVVYVNAQGQPISTKTVNAGSSAPTAAVQQAPPPAEPTAAAATSQAPPPPPPAASSAAPAAQQNSGSSSGSNSGSGSGSGSNGNSNSNSNSASISNGGNKANSGVGIVYSPYTAGGQCKTQDQVNTDFAQLSTFGYGLVRLYGTDCNQISTVGNAARAAGMKLFAGVFDISQVQSEVQTIIDSSNGDMSYIHTVSIGNELVNQGKATPGAVVAAINVARGMLGAAGYKGHIVTVDTFNALIANPVLCQNSDYAAANAHPFFDPSILPIGAGAWALATKAAVGAACGKEVLITETGMPWGGSCDGTMCPSYDNQKTALNSLSTVFPSGGYILLSAYNDLWKVNAAYNFYAEQSWGIYGDAPSA